MSRLAAAQSLPGSVLFVCGMNAIRSPMAEHLLRNRFGQAIFTQSAGIHSGDPDPFMVAVMGEAGIDLSAHNPVTLDDLGDSYFDLIVTLSPEAHHRAMELAGTQAVEVEYWPTMDPSTIAGRRDQVIEAYRQTRDMLDKRIVERFGEHGRLGKHLGA